MSPDSLLPQRGLSRTADEEECRRGGEGSTIVGKGGIVNEK